MATTTAAASAAALRQHWFLSSTMFERLSSSTFSWFPYNGGSVLLVILLALLYWLDRRRTYTGRPLLSAWFVRAVKRFLLGHTKKTTSVPEATSAGKKKKKQQHDEEDIDSIYSLPGKIFALSRQVQLPFLFVCLQHNARAFHPDCTSCVVN